MVQDLDRVQEKIFTSSMMPPTNGALSVLEHPVPHAECQAFSPPDLTLARSITIYYLG